MRSRFAYDKMVEQYDTFFAAEKQQAEKRLNALVSGRQIHELIKQVVDFYENKEKNEHRVHLFDEATQMQMKEMKKQLDQFVDGLIETLNNEFNEKTVTPYSSRKDKIALLKRLVKEIDQEVYADTTELFKLIG